MNFDTFSIFRGEKKWKFTIVSSENLYGNSVKQFLV